MKVKLQDNVFVVIEDDLRDDFDHSKTKGTLTYVTKSATGEEEAKSIELTVSDEFIADTFGITGITDNDRLEVAKLLAQRIFKEQHGIPKGVRSVMALKVHNPLIYAGEIDMKGMPQP